VLKLCALNCWWISCKPRKISCRLFALSFRYIKKVLKRSS
jgi:hypothetical protein